MNKFENASNAELMAHYEEWLSLEKTGICKNEPLRSVLDEYCDLSANGIHLCTVDLLRTIADRWYDEKHSECSETSKFLLTYTAQDKSEEVGGFQWANTEEDLRVYAAELKSEIGDNFILEDAIEVLKYRDIEID